MRTKQKNPAAVALGSLGAKARTSEQQQASAKSRAAKLSPERRREIALLGVAARAKKRAAKNKSGNRKSNKT